LQGDNGAVFLGPKLKDQWQGLALFNGHWHSKPKTVGNGFQGCSAAARAISRKAGSGINPFGPLSQQA
jgi:hypothetical protein